MATRKYTFTSLAVLLALLGLLCNVGRPAQAAPSAGARVTLHPGTAALDVGDTLTVEVWAEDVTNLYGAEIHLDFDPAVFQVLDENESLSGVQILLREDLLQLAFVIYQDANNTTGLIRYAGSQSNPTPPASGSGALFQFRLQALKPAVSPVEVSLHQLAATGGEPIVSTAEGAVFTVLGEGARYTLALPVVVR